MSDDQDHVDDRDGRAGARPVTSMSLRAERLRRSMAKAAGASLENDPGLSTPPPPRDPELVNRFAVAGFTVGLLALFIDAVGIPSIVAIVFCVLGLRRARELDARGKGPFGRRRCLWGIGFAVFGLANIAFNLFVRPLFAP